MVFVVVQDNSQGGATSTRFSTLKGGIADGFVEGHNRFECDYSAAYKISASDGYGVCLMLPVPLLMPL
jgi:hypothetical protein